MYNSPFYSSQIKNELSKRQYVQLIDEYFSFLVEFNCVGFIAITGDDPILSDGFWDILGHIIKNYSDKCSVAILGNSYYIDTDVVTKMNQLGVEFYQISLDGMEDTHDYLRKPGSFQDSLRALKVIHEAKIISTVSFTLSKLNASELIPLFEFLRTQEYIDYFGFYRMIPTGTAVKK